ncbi:MAG: MFS transporter, partial [Clostridiales bacterium]|nr:MFS transporter [Clostridiales bacterium]
MITSFITPFMRNAINLAIPSIGTEFGASQSLLNWVVSGYLIATAAFLLPFGRLADQYGRKKIFLTGMVLLAASSLGCALSPSLIALICFRAIQGVASAMIFGTAMAILTSVIPPETRGRALGLNSAATYIGLSCGPVLGGFISSAFTWRAVFYFNLLIAVVVIVLTVWKLKGEWKGEASRLDSGGIVLCILAQAFILFGLTKLTANLLYQVSFLLGVVLLVVFYLYEKKRRDPLIPIDRILRNRPFAFANLASLINYSATFALSFVLSLYLQAALRLDAGISGLVLLVQPVLMAVLSPVTGALSDRLSPAVLASAGMGLSALGLLFFVFLTTETPIILIILNLAFIGLGFSLFATPNTNAIMGSVDKTLYGIASSILGNMRLLGQAISMAIVSLITSVLIRDQIGSPAYVVQLMASLRTAFIIFTILCILGVFASLARAKVVKQ